MNDLQHLLDANRAWSDRITSADPAFFETLARQQSPQYLWIGCSDSRVPANQIVGLQPGEVFVHRNVANLVVHTDLNCLAVMQYAIDVLKVRHVIVCGHYGCGGIEAVVTGARVGLADNWLRHVRDVLDKHATRLGAVPEAERRERLCELNVLEQVFHACHTTIVLDAWSRGQPLSVHGWCYGLKDGRLRDLGASASSCDELEARHGPAVERAIFGSARG